MTIGIFGGSFNPVHIGHTLLASWLAQFTALDQVWMSLSPENPLKAPLAASYDHRLAMLRIALARDTCVLPCDIERSLPLPSYTITTLRELQRRYPEHTFRLIIGSDNWHIFSRWRDYQEITDSFSPIISPRPGYPVDPASLPVGVELVNAPVVEISSTMVREYIAQGKDMNHFLPCGVYNYILTHHLYEQPINP